MNLKELVFQFLKEEGFCPKEADFGLEFKAEGKNFLFVYDKDDEKYFRLMMPAIFQGTEENREAVLEAMDANNRGIKVVKTFTFQDGTVWLSFEILADSTPIIADILPRALSMLVSAQRSFYEAIG